MQNFVEGGQEGIDVVTAAEDAARRQEKQEQMEEGGKADADQPFRKQCGGNDEKVRKREGGVARLCVRGKPKSGKDLKHRKGRKDRADGFFFPQAFFCMCEKILIHDDLAVKSMQQAHSV